MKIITTVYNLVTAFLTPAYVHVCIITEEIDKLKTQTPRNSLPGCIPNCDGIWSEYFVYTRICCIQIIPVFSLHSGPTVHAKRTPFAHCIPNIPVHVFWSNALLFRLTLVQKQVQI